MGFHICHELHVITSAVHKWRHYLLGHPFVIITDHKSLKELMSQVIQIPEQQTYLSKLLGYDYSIQYWPGSGNVTTDALSHIPYLGGQCWSLSLPNFVFIDQLCHSLQDNVESRDLSHNVQHQPDTYSSFTITNDLIFFQGKV